MAILKKMYTAHASSTGGRDGHSKSDDGKLEVTLAAPREMGGTGEGTNPEQLFAAGYSACFLGAMRFVAGQQGKNVPSDASVMADVSIGPLAGDVVGFGIEAVLNVSLPGWEFAAASQLVDAAHQICPYSNATRTNVDVTLNVSV
ncbi:organic hydroperoxide resistance protein [Aquincola tertiaricarbonis]|uniref:organic hydroperoxide resistance protein n=1 Tax=Aquincola tertiaricarbonis TaxID=391953 RepID=UPI0006153B5D|nr:organic hydroperoxide resistance protein [Aquincola tertiaricarbonis]